MTNSTKTHAPLAGDNPKQHKWNQRYQQATSANAPAQVLSDNTHLFPRHGEALDLACGLGGNALLLAHSGLTTQAWDISDVAIAKLQLLADQQQLPLQPRCIDLQQQPLPASAFDLISVSGFLDRALCASICAALKPNGMLFYQTHTLAKAIDARGPSSPEFLLQSGELLSLFAELTPVVYREERDCGDLQNGLRNQAYLVARKTA
ncbi:MAG: class I SAM-dependent methyltransferase [Motiliproteus sp.]